MCEKYSMWQHWKLYTVLNSLAPSSDSVWSSKVCRCALELCFPRCFFMFSATASPHTLQIINVSAPNQTSLIAKHPVWATFWRVCPIIESHTKPMTSWSIRSGAILRLESFEARRMSSQTNILNDLPSMVWSSKIVFFWVKKMLSSRKLFTWQAKENPLVLDKDNCIPPEEESFLSVSAAFPLPM